MTGYEAVPAALLLAYCFFSLGEVFLSRDSRDILAVNQSFLTGLSMAAITFFPLSVFFPGGALTLVMVVLSGAGGLKTYRLIANRSFPRLSRFAELSDPPTLVFLALIVFAFVQFWVQNFRLSFLWDGFQIWATKAMVIYHDGALGKRLINTPDEALERYLDYPPMLPLFEALLSRFRGVFEWNAVKAVFDFFYLSLLISTYDAARSLVCRRTAMGATALLALIPAVSTRNAIAGYADMPQAALVAGALAALLGAATSKIGIRSPIPWIVAGVLFVKSEGVILLFVICAAVAAYTLLRPARTVREWVREQWPAYLVIAASYLVRRGLTRWLNIVDVTYGPLDHAHFQKALANLALVPKLCFSHATAMVQWGVFWPAFAVAAIIVLVAGKKRERILTLATAAAVTAYTCIFYFTSWPIPLHIDQAYDRLLSQISPAAVLVIAVAFERLWGSTRPSIQATIPPTAEPFVESV